MVVSNGIKIRGPLHCKLSDPEGRICRWCDRHDGEDNARIVIPCKCFGFGQFACVKCLEEWIKQGPNKTWRKCRKCGELIKLTRQVLPIEEWNLYHLNLYLAKFNNDYYTDNGHGHGLNDGAENNDHGSNDGEDNGHGSNDGADNNGHGSNDGADNDGHGSNDNDNNNGAGVGNASYGRNLSSFPFEHLTKADKQRLSKLPEKLFGRQKSIWLVMHRLLVLLVIAVVVHVRCWVSGRPQTVQTFQRPWLVGMIPVLQACIFDALFVRPHKICDSLFFMRIAFLSEQRKNSVYRYREGNNA